MSSYDSSLEAGNSCEHRVFKGCGRVAANHYWKICIVGHILFIGISFGLYNAEVETRVAELWVETGSRLRTERALYQERFGPGTRLQLIAFHNNAGFGQTSTTKALLGEVMGTMAPLLVENILAPPVDGIRTPGAPVPYSPAFATEHTFTVNGVTNTRNWTVANMCERPPVPKLFAPITAEDAGAAAFCDVPTKAHIFAQNFASWGYNHIAQCFANSMKSTPMDISQFFAAVGPAGAAAINTGANLSFYHGMFGGLFAPTTLGGVGFEAFDAINTASIKWPTDAPAAATPVSWGIQRFPCTRLSVFDCFQEGAFDYPRDLALVDGLGLFLYLTNQGAAVEVNGQSPLTTAILATIKGAVKQVAATAGLGTNIMWPGGLGPSFENELNTTMGLIGAYVAPIWAAAKTNWQTCKTNAQSTVAADMVTVNATANCSINGVPLKGSFTLAQLGGAQAGAVGAIQFFGGVGFGWRRSMAAQPGNDVTSLIYNSVMSSRNGTSSAACLGATLASTAAASCCPLWSGTLVPDNLWLGAGATASVIPAHRFVINLFSENAPQFNLDIKRYTSLAAAPTQEEQMKLCVKFEEKWIAYLEGFWLRQDTATCAGCATKLNTLNLLMQDSVNNIVKDASNPGAELVIAGYVILIVFTAVAVFRTPLVYSRVALGMLAIWTVLLAVVASFGLTALFLTFTPLSTNLVPFLGLGLGMDDAYVLMQTSTLVTKYSDDPVKRMEEIMVLSGPSVMLTSVTVSVSFFVSSLTPIPAVTSFVLQMGFCIILNFVALILIFVPFVAWDATRISEKRMDCVCCFKDENVEAEHTAVDVHGGVVNRCMSACGVPFMKNVFGKIFILVVGSAFFAILCYFAFDLVKEGFLLSDIALKGSYQRDYVQVQEKYFGGYSSNLVTLSKTSDWGSATAAPCGADCKQRVQINILDKLNASPVVAKVRSTYDLSWLLDGQTSLLGFKATLPSAAVFTNPPFPASGDTMLGALGGASEVANWQSNVQPMPPIVFNGVFQSWVGAFGATSLLNLACTSTDFPNQFLSCKDFKADGKWKLEGTSTSIYTTNLVTDDDYVAVIKDGRARVDEVDGQNSFMYGYVYQYWDQYVNVQRQLLVIVGWALLGCFVSTLALQFSPFTSLLVCIIIVKVVIECYGFIYVLGIKLNAFSLVNITIAVGMAVEFTAHPSHCFLMAKGSRNDRMEFALMEMMAPMVNGMLSSFLAVIALAFARFPFFVAYYFGMFSFIILICFLDGMFFLPVVLSLIGPAEFSTAQTPATNSMAMKQLESRPTGTYDDDTTAV